MKILILLLNDLIVSFLDDTGDFRHIILYNKKYIYNVKF